MIIIAIVVKSPSISVVVFIIIVLNHHPSTGEHVVELPEHRPPNDHSQVVQHSQCDHAQPLKIVRLMAVLTLIGYKNDDSQEDIDQSSLKQHWQ